MIRMSLLSLLCLLFPALIYAQSEHFIKAQLIDVETELPVSGVTVYYRGTSVYAETDANGLFVIPVYTRAKTELIISHLGYELQAYASPFTDIPQVIYMSKKLQELDEVVVMTDMYTRDQLLKAFKEHFLGTDAAGKSCVIENEDMINLKYNVEERKLSASASTPIHIYNKYLGYYIDFDLLFFEVVFSPPRHISVFYQSSLYYGFPLFKTIQPDRKYVKRRDKVYQSSPTHFFTSLYEHDLPNSGFFLLRKNRMVHPDAVFALEDSMQYKKVKIIYNPDKEEQRRITMSKGQSLGDFFNHLATTDLSKEQVGEIKSFSYEPTPEDEEREAKQREEEEKEAQQKKKEEGFRIAAQYKQKHISDLVFYVDEFMIDQYGGVDVINQIYFGGEFAKNRLGRMLPIDFVPSKKDK